MYRFYVYIEADKFVLALMIYADTKSQARKMAVKEFIELIYVKITGGLEGTNIRKR